MKADLLHRMRGCLAGLAVGDALGTTLEFKAPGSFAPLKDMMGGGPFALKPGQWTDDTSMALCLAESLLEKGWDPGDQMDRYVRWWKTGENSSTGRCFDIGNTVRNALADYLRSRDPFPGSTDPHTAGNGSLMRLAPIPIHYWREPELALQRAADMSRTTHGARTCLDACRYTTALILHLLNGTPKTEALDTAALVPDLCP
jgi:ADP-ribosyl-[dinitrogen reductase] hydrolase